nr:hypothetical protein CFP56_36152 [Quercus suber]
MPRGKSPAPTVASGGSVAEPPNFFLKNFSPPSRRIRVQAQALTRDPTRGCRKYASRGLDLRGTGKKKNPLADAQSDAKSSSFTGPVSSSSHQSSASSRASSACSASYHRIRHCSGFSSRGAPGRPAGRGARRARGVTTYECGARGELRARGGGVGRSKCRNLLRVRRHDAIRRDLHARKALLRA